MAHLINQEDKTYTNHTRATPLPIFQYSQLYPLCFHKKPISMAFFFKKVWKNLRLSDRLYNFAPMPGKPKG